MKKKNLLRNIKTLLLSFLILQLIGCEKDDEVRIIFNHNLVYETLTDIEGNVYKTIEIGTQTWMAENLRVTKMNDASSSIPCSWVFNDPLAFKNTYGALYNWNTVNTGKICPQGWHVPNDDEWAILTNYLGGDSIAGGKLKETGTKHWLNPNLGATNESGFTALPIELWFDLGEMGFLWSSSEFNNDYAWYRALDQNSAAVYRNFTSKNMEYSVRCLKD